MKKLIPTIAATIAAAAATGALAHDEEEMRAQLDAARAKMADAAQEVAEFAHGWRFDAPDRAYLGVMIADGDEAGIHIGGVTPDSGADKAGVVPADIIVGINGESLTGAKRPVEKLLTVLEKVSPGDKVELQVLRDADTKAFDVTTSAFPADAGGWARQIGRVWRPWRERLTSALPLHLPFGHDGLQLEDIGADLGDYFGVDAGVMVLDAPPNSELKPGDIVQRIDGADVASADEAYRLLSRPAPADAENREVQVRRKNRSVTVSMALSKHPTVIESHHAVPSGVYFLDEDETPIVEIEVEEELDTL